MPNEGDRILMPDGNVVVYRVAKVGSDEDYIDVDGIANPIEGVISEQQAELLNGLIDGGE